jgi:hypothetical protein
MAVAPLIRTPQVQGGTFYTFSSAAKDLSKTINNTNLRFVFSKYVLLDLPDFNSLPFSDFGDYNNYMQFNTIDGCIVNGGLTGDPNVDFAQSLQNYALNFESLILNDVEYDTSLKQGVAERLFFKWLKETGAIRFRNATTAEVSPTVLNPRFVEEDSAGTGAVQYQRVVKFIGDIDVINNVEKGGDSYTEVYIYVPTQVGNTPTVLFQTTSDANYQPDMIAQGNSEYILGRSIDTIHPEGLDIRAYYDVDDQVDWTDPDADWMNDPYPQTVVNAYFTQPSSFTDATNSDIQKYPADYNNPVGFNGVAYRRTNLDGIGVDFEANDYASIVADPNLDTIMQFNGSDQAGNFEFNAVLVYYDLYDVSNPLNKSTNLYGILLLDNITPTTEGGYIQRLQKFKPNSLTGENGNSYGFKLNLRIDASSVTVGVNSIVNEYSNFSTGQFVEAVAELQQSVRFFESQQLKYTELNTRVQALENRAATIPNVQDINGKIQTLETNLQNARMNYSSSTALLDMINKINKELNALVNGSISVNLQYNTDVLYQGPGIVLDKSVPNKIKIANKVQTYAIDAPSDLNGALITAATPLDISISSPGVVYLLEPYTNMCRVYTTGSAGGDLKIFIDDSSAPFLKGQVSRVVFPNIVDMAGRNIQIFTDSVNRKGFGNYGVTVGNIFASDLSSSRPIFEVTCLDADLYVFAIDILR